MFTTDLPYFKQLLSDAPGRTKFVLMFVKLNKTRPAAAEKLMRALISEYRRLVKAINEGAPDPVIQTCSALKMSLATVSNHLRMSSSETPGHVPMMPAFLYYTKVEKMLGTQRSLDRLHRLLDMVRMGSDFERCIAAISKTAPVTRCPYCNRYEYESHYVETWDRASKICRRCQGSGSWQRSELYNGRFIREDDCRRAMHHNGQSVYISCNDDDFVYNEEDDYWHHRDYTPPPPPILSSYHSSKSLQRPIADEWSTERGRWFGVELEVEIHESRVGREEKAVQLHKVLNDEQIGKRAFFENDGSLSNGFEIITQPMSLPMHQRFWSWLNDRNLIKDLRSHNTSTCGLHVHVTKECMTSLQQAKVVTFVNDPSNMQLITAVARRYAEGYCKIKTKDLHNALATTDRYEAVNVTPRRTIEFRIFKGSLKYESVVAAIEFCNALVEFAIADQGATASSLKIDNFIEFINNQAAAETETLRPYLNQRLEMA